MNDRSSMIEFVVPGTPQQQGSKRNVGKVSIEANPNLAPWRAEAIAAARAAYDGPPLLGPVWVYVTFYYTRPKSHYRTGKKAHLLRDDAPDFKQSAPDTDKLQRAVGDALEQSGLLRNDAQIVHWVAGKKYGSPPRSEIRVVEG